MSSKYKIHPAIGIARVGDSEDYYIAPAMAGALPTDYSTKPPAGTFFRDAGGKLLRQAARFKIYEYPAANPAGVLVVPGQNGVKAIRWTTWIASKKASWFEFMQQTGSGMGPYVPGTEMPEPANAPYAYKNDAGYKANNDNNNFIPNKPPIPPQWTDMKSPTRPEYLNKPSNPLRYNLLLQTSNDPGTIADPKRQFLILDPGPLSLDAPNQSADFDLDPAVYSFLQKLNPFPITTLGSAQTDAGGNLLVLGGFGHSGTTSNEGPVITAYANNEGWFDDIADGPVTAVIIMDDGTEIVVDVPAWVSVAPPRYAPQIINQVNLYDDMYDIYVRELNANPALYNNGAFQASYVPNYQAEVRPILLRPDAYKYVAAIPSLGVANHIDIITDSPGGFAGFAAKYLRGRGTQGSAVSGPAENAPTLMPLLAGDNPISNFTVSKFLGLTATQFFILTQFTNGLVDMNASPPQLPAGPAVDKANLENCVGGAFCPGIEITWITRNTSIYAPLPAGFDASDLFRIKQKDISKLSKGKLSLTNGADNDYSNGLEPGDLTKYMAQPWQADFNECSIQNINTIGLNQPAIQNAQVNIWWWPAQRPYSVIPKDDQQEQVQWDRGFVMDTATNNRSDVQMVTCWKYMGFIMLEGSFPDAFEVERNTAAIDAYQPPEPVESEARLIAIRRNGS